MRLCSHIVRTQFDELSATNSIIKSIQMHVVDDVYVSNHGCALAKSAHSGFYVENLFSCFIRAMFQIIPITELWFFSLSPASPSFKFIFHSVGNSYNRHRLLDMMVLMQY